MAKRQRLAEPAPAQTAAAVPPTACPPHPGFMGGICIRCGALKEGSTTGPAATAAVPAALHSVALSYIHAGLEVSASEAARLAADTAARLAADRRLLLVLDLDHTLLNSTRFQDLPSEGGRALGSLCVATRAGGPAQARPGGRAQFRLAVRRRPSPAPPTAEQVLHTQLKAQPTDAPLLFCLPHMHMWTKLRPGVRQFLETARQHFELHIYTMGDRAYAAEMAHLLDPQQHLFHGGIISAVSVRVRSGGDVEREWGGGDCLIPAASCCPFSPGHTPVCRPMLQADSTRPDAKDLDVVLGHEECVLVLDDTEGVWPRHRDNLLVIKRYLYFPACAAKLGGGRRAGGMQCVGVIPRSPAWPDVHGMSL